MTLRLPVNGPTWLPTFARSIIDAISRSRSLSGYPLAALPDPMVVASTSILVDTGSAKRPAYSDGTDWRWFSDDTIVS